MVSEVPSERSIFTLNSAIAAVSEGNYGRLGAGQQGSTSRATRAASSTRRMWEMPGAMPEILPSPDFVANIDRLFTERSMVMQAWGAYGMLWPVIHQWLGVSPDIGRGRVAVVPQIPDGQTTASATQDPARLGPASTWRRSTGARTTSPGDPARPDGLTIGAVLPRARRSPRPR